MAKQPNASPVIIKRKKIIQGGGHHGGAWKVAILVTFHAPGTLCPAWEGPSVDGMKGVLAGADLSGRATPDLGCTRIWHCGALTEA